MQPIKTVEALETLYPQVTEKSLTKVVDHITPVYAEWITQAKFVILSTVGPDGTDASPRGDDGPVVTIADAQTLHLPDWRGNNRLDSLKNIVRDPRVSLMFMVPGSGNVVRVNGTALVTNDPGLCAGFAKSGKQPATVTVITVQEAYFQCAKALMRSKLWGDTPAPKDLPSAGDFLKSVDPLLDAKGYDAGYAEYAKPLMW